MAEITEVTSDNFESAVLSSEQALLVYYYAPWCIPCKDMKETVAAVADEIAEKIKTVRVNTDSEDVIVTRQKIVSIPSFQLIEKGKQVALLRGKQSKLDLIGGLTSALTANGESDGE